MSRLSSLPRRVGVATTSTSSATRVTARWPPMQSRSAISGPGRAGRAGRIESSVPLTQFRQVDQIQTRALSSTCASPSPLDPTDSFTRRHIGPSKSDQVAMVATLKPTAQSMDDFIDQVIPSDIRLKSGLVVDGVGPNRPYSESELIGRLRKIAAKNQVLRSYIGTGYAGTLVPEVIKRNVLENPGWYTSYTPYQAEISQGRLESLVNFQTVVTDLTGLPIANASVLDEATAAAEALTMSLAAIGPKRQKRQGKAFVVSHLVHPQTIDVMRSRASGFGVRLVVADVMADGKQIAASLADDLVGMMVQYPNTEGGVDNFAGLADAVHASGGSFCAATDLLALTVLRPPAEFGADIAFGSAQRFGVPFGFGGPHAGFLAATDAHKRRLPGRIIGLSRDRRGKPAYRLALQTREQHIRREKATSNICTAQALLANMAAFYAVYHGPEGLRAIANRVVAAAQTVQRSLTAAGFSAGSTTGAGQSQPVVFDTVVVSDIDADAVLASAVATKGINFRRLDCNRVGITVDETVSGADLADIVAVFQPFSPSKADAGPLRQHLRPAEIPAELRRTSEFLTHPVFNTHHSETELLRYIHSLQAKDLSLTHSMIPLGSCTMKLNATTEMAAITWPEFSGIHPFAPTDQTAGYRELIAELEADLCAITGFDAVSVQPNSGAQGEFAALRVIRQYFAASGQPGRDVCLIPVSAHGTNPASAAMAGMRVVPVKCDSATGNLDMKDLEAKCVAHKDDLAAVMVTYPSTFGVFEPAIRAICETVHRYGGQVYMDGANMNAQIGLCSPGDIGADACHLNLHKTFCIPHGGGGPGVGPIGVKAHLSRFLPGHPVINPRPETNSSDAIPAVSAAPFGSAGILPISWAYIKMMAGPGLTEASKTTILNANYLMNRLKDAFPIVYTNAAGRCAHEFILDIRPFGKTAGVQAADVAKRLQDYGFHAPTMSWPVPNTLMVEPTESESRAEMDRFADALLAIRAEIADIEAGRQPREGNVLQMAPHTMEDVVATEWDRPYSREQAAFPLPWLRERKFWPSVARLDDAYGDTNLFCTCPPVEAEAEAESS